MSGGFLRARLSKREVERFLAEEARRREGQEGEGRGAGPAGAEPSAAPSAEQRRGFSLPRLGFPRFSLPRPRPALRAPKLRIPTVRMRRGRLEGAEALELPVPEGARALRVRSGTLYIGESVIAVYPRVGEGAPFGPLQPLVEVEGLQELFITEVDGQASIVATISGRRYRVILPRQLLVERLAQNIAIVSGIPLSERNPQGSGEYHGFRVNLAMPLLSGGWQITLTRLTQLSSISFDPLLTARLVTLLASPVSMLIYGPPGSGKTTLLIHILNTLTSLFPSASVSIVEEEPEVALHVRAPNVRRYFSFQRTVTDNVRITRRYDRPDVLVVGELRGEEVLSWFEAAGSGIPVLATVHAKSLAEARGRLDTIIQSSGIKASILDVIPLYVETGKMLVQESIARGVQAVYIYTGEGFAVLYKGDMHATEEEFLEFLPPRLQFSFRGEDARETYEEVKRRLGVDMHRYRLVRLGRVTLDELSLQAE